MKKLLLLGMLVATDAFGLDLNLDYFDMRYEKFYKARDPYAPQYDNEWDYRIAADFNMSLNGVLYWNNNTHFETLQSQTPKTVGWQYELGLHLTDFMDFYKSHHSKHLFEESSDTTSSTGVNKFPVEDTFGLRVKFVDDPSHRNSVSNLIFGK